MIALACGERGADVRPDFSWTKKPVGIVDATRNSPGDQMMRACIFALAAIIPAFAIDRVGAADDPPAFDIAKNCREEVVGSIATAAACTRDETAAKDELAKRWSSFGASVRKSCIGEADIGSDKSYVELLTCLEMATGQPIRPEE